MIVNVAIFWVALFFILYAYVGYPAILWLVSRFRTHGEGDRAGQNTYLPSVTLIISAYNEENVIGEKIENALSLDYPQELLEVVIVSDGSTDRTVEIVRKAAHRGVVLRHYEGRIGKTACLNRALPLAAGQIIVFSDANSTYGDGAIRALIRPLDDSTVGFVTGWTKYESRDGATADTLGLYSRLELLTKELESRVGSCVGADGAIFAIRRELYVPLRDYDINDLVIPLSINQQGYRGVLQRDAICFEKDAGGTKREFRRQVRITSRAIRAIMNYRRLLNPFEYGAFSLELFSHKLCKFLVPGFMIALLVSNLLLAGQGRFFVLSLTAQGIFYVGAAATSVIPTTGAVWFRIAQAARGFAVFNAAVAVAWIRYFQGETYTTWSPTER